MAHDKLGATAIVIRMTMGGKGHKDDVREQKFIQGGIRGTCRPSQDLTLIILG